MGWRNYDDYFPQSRPRQARGGIKAQTQRGSFGATWWAHRWLQVLEQFDLGARLSRGRSYARSGQVLEIKIAVGEVTARVQGSRPTPYAVTINLPPLKDKQWRQVGAVLAGQAVFAAMLLAGQMPPEIESAFTAAGQSLFPTQPAELMTSCSCPDWSNPCKHVAAVYYLLGEEFDRDPFLLFRLRGLDRAGLVALLEQVQPAGPAPEQPAPTSRATETAAPATARRARRAVAPPAGRAAAAVPAAAAAVPAAAAPVTAVEELPTDPATFWQGGALPPELTGLVELPGRTAVVLERLGAFPFWRGQVSLLTALSPLYETAANAGLAIAAGIARTAADGADGVG